MNSAMCKAGHHVDCQIVYQLPPGKKFRCACSCHAPVVERQNPEEFDEDDGFNENFE